MNAPSRRFRAPWGWVVVQLVPRRLTRVAMAWKIGCSLACVCVRHASTSLAT